jgi:hypothetical protein
MQPTPGDVHVNRPLTNISIAFLQRASAFVADRVFPNIPVMKQSDRYFTYDRGMFNRDEMKLRAPGTETAGVEFTVDSTPTYFANPYGIHHDIPDQVRANADVPLAPDREATELVTHKALIRREKLWAQKYFAASLWSRDRTGVAAAPAGIQFLQWSDAASTPVEDIRGEIIRQQELTAFKPNTLVLGAHVANSLLDHPDIVDRIKYGQTPNGPAVAELTELAKIFKIERVMVMEGVENTAVEGATNSHSFIGGKGALLCYSAMNPGIMTPTAGYTFSWNGYLGAGAAGGRIKRFRMEHLAADRVEMEMAFDQKLVAADMGTFFATAVA